MKLQRWSAIRGCSPDPGGFPFAVKIDLYKTCRHCLGKVSEEWDLTNYKPQATAASIQELIP